MPGFSTAFRSRENKRSSLAMHAAHASARFQQIHLIAPQNLAAAIAGCPENDAEQVANRIQQHACPRGLFPNNTMADRGSQQHASANTPQQGSACPGQPMVRMKSA